MFLVVSTVAFGVLEISKSWFSRYLFAVARRARPHWVPVIEELYKKTRNFFLLFLALAIGIQLLDLPDRLHGIIRRAAVIILLLQGGIWTSILIRVGLNRYLASQEGPGSEAQNPSITALTYAARIVLWSVVAMLVLDNLGFNITTLVASLGVGGIAVALAVQKILGDLLSSLSIILDKPFVVGDSIVVDGLSGNVEKIGIKTTRVRSLSGEQLVFSNSDLLQSRIHNFKRMSERRVLFTLGVVYGTSYEQLKEIPSWVGEIISKEPLARFERAHFKEFGPSSLDFEIVYWMKTADFTEYRNAQQQINLGLFQKFEKEGVEFAYPTQTLFLEKN